MMHRFPEGLSGEKVHQKRLPRGAPPWVETVRVFFPDSSRTPTSCASPSSASVIWAVQMSTVEFHPWNSRRADTEQPDEWRIDLDPMPECGFDTVRRVAHVAHEVLDELGAVGWPKTSGGKGMHVYVRIEPRWGFADVRRAALAFAREVERRAPRGRHHHVVAQGPRPADAVRGLQPERPRPHDRQRLLGARRARGDGVDADHAGTRSTTSSRATSPSPPCPRRFADAGRPARRHRRRGVLASTPCWSGPTATSARGAGPRRPGRRHGRAAWVSPGSPDRGTGSGVLRLPGRHRADQLVRRVRGGDAGDLGVVVGGRHLDDVGADEVEVARSRAGCPAARGWSGRRPPGCRCPARTPGRARRCRGRRRSAGRPRGP